MKNNVYKNLIAVLLILGLISNANAMLIDNGSYSTDESIGLDWLDFTETVGKTYNNSLTIYSGWRMATLYELSRLIKISFPGFVDSRNGVSQYSDSIIFSNLFGITQHFPVRQGEQFYSVSLFKPPNGFSFYSFGSVHRNTDQFSEVYGVSFLEVQGLSTVTVIIKILATP